MTKPRPFQPARSGSSAQRLEEVERQVEPVGLLGVDVEADVVGLRQRREALHARQQFAHHAGALASRW